MAKIRMVFTKDNPGRVVLVLCLDMAYEAINEFTELLADCVWSNGKLKLRECLRGDSISSIFIYYFPPELARSVREWAEQRPDVVVEER